MRKSITKSIYIIVLFAVIILLSACSCTGTPIEEEVPVIEEVVEEPAEVYEPVDLIETDKPDTVYEVVEERTINPFVAQLREQYGNDEIVGYLYIEGTDIRYPVTQYIDNVFYLYHDVHRQSDRAGWIFLDYANDITREEPNTIIYGHNMRQNIRFHGIRNFQNRGFFEAHRYITLHTVYEEQRWEIFSFYRTNIDFFYIQVEFESDEEFYALLSEMAARSMHESGVEVGPGDRVLTLSTCTNAARDERFVINARLIQE